MAIDVIDLFVDQAMIGAGVSTEWMDAHGFQARGVVSQPVRKHMPRWTPKEEEFLRANRGTMSEAEIAARLGRSQAAIKCRGYHLSAISPRYTSGYISGNQIARLLSVDSHIPPAWIDRGILEGEHFPYLGRVCRRVRWMAFKRWLIRPTSWVFFDARLIKNDHLRSLVLRAQQRWGDEWLTTRQAADLRGCSLQDVQNSIKHGRLEGYHAGSLDRRRTWGWAHWFVRRSDALTFEIRKGRRRVSGWSPMADAFIVRSAAAGRSWEDVACMMKWPLKRVQYRALLLRRMGLLPETKKRGAITGKTSGRTCVVCGQPSTLRGKTCGSPECRAERIRRYGRLAYARKKLARLEVNYEWQVWP